MTEYQFINEIQSELTISGSLPITVPEAEIQRIIRQELKFFKENYEHALSRGHYIIKKSSMNNSPEFRRDRIILMPQCVHAISQFKEINGVGRLGNIDRDFSESRLIASEIFLSSFHGDDLVLRTANYAWYDLNKAYFLEHIQFSYNHNTRELKVEGRMPINDVYVETWNDIEKEHMYDDYYFMRWCIAKAKISFARILGTYPFPLPGNVTVNYDMWKSEGETEINEIKEYLKSINVADWFYIFH